MRLRRRQIDVLEARLDTLAELLRSLKTKSPGGASRPVRPNELVAREVGGSAVEAGRRRLHPGWLPCLAVMSAIGLSICTLGDALSRSTLTTLQLPFWVGLIVVFFPIVFRLCSGAPRRVERISLCVLLGITLYLVKVVHDPFAFTYADELVHAHNVNEIIRTHHLFNSNPILPVTPKYPGLESVAAGVRSLTGFGTFGSGLILIGGARLVIMLALFLFFERLSGSARIAGVGSAVYAANSNFVFFSAQFSYESLALPLLVLVLFAVAELASDHHSRRRAWSIVTLLVVAAVVVTHHLTSYAMVILLCTLALVGSLVRPRRWLNLWPFAIFALLVTLVWLIVVASTTVGYLTPVFTKALTSTIHTVAGEAAPRHLFASSTGGYTAPLLERGVGIASVLLVAAGAPLGLRAVWRRSRRNPFALVLSAAAVAYFGVVLLRFIPSAWETANRASEFLFIGLAFVLAFVPFRHGQPTRVLRVLLAACAAVIFAGGVIAGWQPLLRESQPYTVAAGAGVIEPEGRQLASWAANQLGSNQRIVASDSDGRLLLVYADEQALIGRGGKDQPDSTDILQTPVLADWEIASLLANRVAYVATDRRLRSFDPLYGYFFGRRPGAGVPDSVLDPSTATKFDRFGASRIYDSGTIKVYDLRSVFGGKNTR